MVKKKTEAGSKKGYGLVLLTVFLVGVYLYLSGTFSKTEEVVGFLEESEIETVEISGGGQKIVLKKEGGAWFVGEGENRIPADGEKVESFVAEVKMVKFDDLVSSNPEKLDLFGLGEEEKYVLSIGGKTLEIGKMAPDWRSVYVKNEGSDEVFLVGSQFDSSLKEGVWERAFLTNFSIYQIKEIEIKEGEEKRVISKKDEEWWEGESLIEKEKADEFVGVLANLSAEEPVKEKVGEKMRSFLIEDEGGERVEIEIGKDWGTDDGIWFYKISPEDYQVLVSF